MDKKKAHGYLWVRGYFAIGGLFLPLAWCATRMTIGTAASQVCGLLSLPNTDYIILYVDVFLEV